MFDSSEKVQHDHFHSVLAFTEPTGTTIQRLTFELFSSPFLPSTFLFYLPLSLSPPPLFSLAASGTEQDAVLRLEKERAEIVSKYDKVRTPPLMKDSISPAVLNVCLSLPDRSWDNNIYRKFPEMCALFSCHRVVIFVRLMVKRLCAHPHLFPLPVASSP